MDEVVKAFEFWITQYPESHHPLDERRFYDFVEKAADAEEHVDSEWLKERARHYSHALNETQLNDFAKRLDVIREYLQDRKAS